MKVLLINGSPHKDGCTANALIEMKKEFDKKNVHVEVFNIPLTPVRGCIACRKCSGNNNHCIFDDDCANELIDKIAENDAIVIGSPVYYAGINGTLKSLLDRVFYAGAKRFTHKPAAAVVSCRRGGASSAFDQVNHYFSISNMHQVGSQYWNQVHGNNKEEVHQDLEGLQTMRTLAKNMIWLMECIEKSGSLPEEESEKQRTNFIR